MIRTFALAALFALSVASAHAQTAIHYRQGDSIDPRDVARVLSASSAPLKTRSIRLLDPGSPAESQVVPAPTSLSVPVQFAFDSAAILPTARAQLDAIAAGIKMLPAGQSVVVAGHTDAVGSDGYNFSLSQRRAAAVKSYLVQVHGIDEKRLDDVGLGKQQPIQGTDPYAPENRRVQFRGR